MSDQKKNDNSHGTGEPVSVTPGSQPGTKKPDPIRTGGENGETAKAT